jgi:hypothetical protein
MGIQHRHDWTFDLVMKVGQGLPTRPLPLVGKLLGIIMDRAKEADLAVQSCTVSYKCFEVRVAFIDDMVATPAWLLEMKHWANATHEALVAYVKQHEPPLAPSTLDP